jgi:hypothetical protein
MKACAVGYVLTRNYETAVSQLNGCRPDPPPSLSLLNFLPGFLSNTTYICIYMV